MPIIQKLQPLYGVQISDTRKIDNSRLILYSMPALNCSINPNVRDMDKINIGGWSAGAGGGVNTPVNMKYGAASIEGEGLDNLYRASLEIHRHLL